MRYKLIIFSAIILFSLTNCGGVSDQLKPLNLFYLQFGNQKGKIGTSQKAGDPFLFDKQRVPSAVSFDSDRLTMIDRYNHKIISFDYEGNLIKEIQLPQKGHYDNIALDPDRNIYFTEKITDKNNSITYKLWSVPEGTTTVKLVRRLQKPKETVIGSKYSIVKKIFSPTENYSLIVWETLYTDSNGTKSSNDPSNEYLTVSQIDLVNINQTGQDGISTFPLTKKQFNPASENKGKFARIINASAFEEDRTVILELIYFPDTIDSNNNKTLLSRELFMLDLVSGNLSRLTVPLDSWTGFYRASSIKGLFFLESVTHNAEETEGIIRIFFPATGEDFSYRIVTNPAHFLVTDFYISRSGQIFSFLLYKNGMQVVTWQK